MIALINVHNFTFIGILSVSREPDPPELKYELWSGSYDMWCLKYVVWNMY